MTYTPFNRHFNKDYALRNPQASGATGRTIGGMVSAPTARRAVRQGLMPSIGGAATSSPAIEALGQPGSDLGITIDSPEPSQGGTGPMDSGAAPLGLGSSNSRVESTRGPGSPVAVAALGEDSAFGALAAKAARSKTPIGRSSAIGALGAKKAQLPGGVTDFLGDTAVQTAMNFPKNLAKLNKVASPLEIGLFSTAQAIPTVAITTGLGLANNWIGGEIDEAAREERAARIAELAGSPSFDADISRGNFGPAIEALGQPEQYGSFTGWLGAKTGFSDKVQEAKTKIGHELHDAAVALGWAESPAYPGTTAFDALTDGLRNEMEQNELSRIEMGTRRNLPGHIVSNKDDVSMHDQLTGRASPQIGGYSGTHRTAMNAKALDLSNGSVRGKDLGPSSGPGVGPGNNPTGGMSVGGRDNGPGGGLSVGVGGQQGNNANRGGGDDGDDSIICSELYRQGLMTKRERMLGYRHSLEHLTDTTLRGYHIWARPAVAAMKRSPRVTAFWRWVWKRRHNEVMRVMGKTKKRDLLGMAIRWVTEGFSWCVGACCDLDPINAKFNRKATKA